MDPVRELLATDHRHVLEFPLGLRDVSEPAVDREELFYNASVLAHYARYPTGRRRMACSRESQDGLRPFCVGHHPAARQPDDGSGRRPVPLLAGFFEDQMRQRHTSVVRELGTGFFSRAAVHERSPRKARLLDAIGRHFEPWRQRHARLSREFRDQPYLLTPSRPLTPM